jgi:hypothetical protein
MVSKSMEPMAFTGSILRDGSNNRTDQYVAVWTIVPVYCLKYVKLLQMYLVQIESGTTVKAIVS